jgi:hypothetical protein
LRAVSPVPRISTRSRIALEKKRTRAVSSRQTVTASGTAMVPSRIRKATSCMRRPKRTQIAEKETSPRIMEIRPNSTSSRSRLPSSPVLAHCMANSTAQNRPLIRTTEIAR